MTEGNTPFETMLTPGMITETATFLTWGGPRSDIALIAAGKNAVMMTG
jgi:hypothetical protein